MYTEKTIFPFPFTVNGIWSRRQFLNQMEFQFGSKTVTTIISHSLWKEMEILFSQCADLLIKHNNSVSSYSPRQKFYCVYSPRLWWSESLIRTLSNFLFLIVILSNVLFLIVIRSNVLFLIRILSNYPLEYFPALKQYVYRTKMNVFVSSRTHIENVL